jgi:hypothetical protein
LPAAGLADAAEVVSDRGADVVVLMDNGARAVSDAGRAPAANRAVPALPDSERVEMFWHSNSRSEAVANEARDAAAAADSAVVAEAEAG